LSHCTDSDVANETRKHESTIFAHRESNAMKRLQFSILTLVLTVVFCAMAMMALRTASDLWLSAIYTGTTVLLLAAIVAARFRRGNEKAFWFGFAVFGWGFFVVGLGPWPNAFGGDDDGMGISLNRNLLTSRVILFLVPYLRAETVDLQRIDKITTNTIGVAHLLITLTLAVFGGVIAMLIRRRRSQLVSVNSLSILAAAGIVTVLAASLISSRHSARHFQRSVVDAFRTGWYSRHLVAMGERPLWMLSGEDPDATVYRLLWLPSFHHSVCVRIHQAGERTTLHVTVLDGKGGYEPGQVAIGKSIIIGPDQVRQLDRHLERAAFWNMPTEEKLDGITVDGDHLIVEGVKGGVYHLVDRLDPDPEYTKLCHQMLSLTGLKMQEAWEGYHPTDDQPEM
jgi:hypothetical protein